MTSVLLYAASHSSISKWRWSTIIITVWFNVRAPYLSLPFESGSLYPLSVSVLCGQLRVLFRVSVRVLEELLRYFTLSGRRTLLLKNPCQFFTSVCQLSLVLHKVYYLVVCFSFLSLLLLSWSLVYLWCDHLFFSSLVFFL